MSVLILGDPHIGKSLGLGKTAIGAALNSRVVDQINLLNWVLERALDNLVSDIIITGDVFEEPKPSPALISVLIDWLKKCSANQIKVHIIVGNHDILRTGHYYTSALDIITACELENIFVYNNMSTILVNSTAFTLLPFRDRKSFNVSSNAEALSLLNNQLVYEVGSIPNHLTKVLVGHLAIEGSIPVGDEIDDLSNELMCPIKMFKDYDFVWMGHVHKPQVLAHHKPYAAHIGSMDISNYGEIEHKKNIIIYDVELNSFKHETLPTRPLKKIVVNVPKDVPNTTQFIIDELNKQGSLEKAIVKLDVHLLAPELLPSDRTELERALYSLGAHNVSGISESKKLTPIHNKEREQLLHLTNDVVPAVKMYADVVIEPHLRNDFVSLALDIYEQFKKEVK